MDRSRKGGRFESSLVGAARIMTKGGDQLGRTVKVRMFYEQIGEKVKGTGLEIRGSVNSRSWRHKKVDRICGATKKKASSESGRR